MLNSRGLLLVCGLLLVAALAVGWLRRDSLLGWYYLQGLDGAALEDRTGWVDCVAGLGEAAVPGLITRLQATDAQACANAEAALTALADRWGLADGRTTQLSGRLRDGFEGFSEPGKQAALGWHVAALRSKGDVPPAHLDDAVSVLGLATARLERGVRLRATALANKLIDRTTGGECLAACRKLIQTELRDAEAEPRRRALRLALHPAFREQPEVLRQVVPLLRDENADVRRAAVLAVGTSPDLVSEDDLLPLLHDADADVRRLCEGALRGRGLQDGHILLGRLISDRDARSRLRVVLHLPEVEGIEPGVWLRRLSRDEAPSVRAAALRLAAENPAVNLRDRIAEMAGSDPSPAVRANARYYLGR